jgi:exosortase
MLANEATNNELATHIIIVPFLITFILYRRRSLLRAAIAGQGGEPPFLHEVLGILVCAIALMLYLGGSYSFYSLEYHLLSMPLFLAGTLLFVFDMNILKAIALPLTFTTLLVPLPLKLVYTLANRLAGFSSEISYFVLKGGGLPIALRYVDETPLLLLSTPHDQLIPLAIDIGCSGIYSLTAFTAFALFIASLTKGGVRRKVALFFIGYPIMYGMNLLRIILIALIGYWFGQDAALGFLHLFGGTILVFLGTLILSIIAEKVLKLRIFRSSEGLSTCPYHERLSLKEEFCPACGSLIRYPDGKISKGDASKIAVLVILATLILSFEVPTFVMTQGLPEIVRQVPLKGESVNLQFIPSLPNLEPKFLYRDTEYEKMLELDAALLYVYLPEDNSRNAIYLDLWIAMERNRFHLWEVCIEPNITFDQRDVMLKDAPPLIGRFFAFQRNRSQLTEVILCWTDEMVFQTPSGFERKYLMVSLAAYIQNSTGYPTIEDQLLTMGKALIDFWQPVKSQSTLAQNVNWLIITLVRHNLAIIGSLMVGISAILLIQLYRSAQNKRRNTKSYYRLTPEDRNILRATHQAQKKGPPTGNAITSEYREIAGEPIEMDRLLQKLGEAERAGLVKRAVRNLEERPILVWRSQYSLTEEGWLNPLQRLTNRLKPSL